MRQQHGRGDVPEDETQALSLRTGYYNRGHDLPDEGEKELLALRFGEPSTRALGSLPSEWGAVVVTPVAAGTAKRRFVLSESEGPGEPIFFINGEFWPNADEV